MGGHGGPERVCDRVERRRAGRVGAPGCLLHAAAQGGRAGEDDPVRRRGGRALPRSRVGWRQRRGWSAAGGSGSSRSASPVSRIASARAARVVFPPEQVAEVKALACELPATQGLPLGRFSRTELHRLVVQRGLSDASASTIWRWLHDDALKPWQQRSWIFVRDPAFAEKAGRVLDLYQRRFQGRRLRPDEYVICADEKSQLQALGRRRASLPPAPGRPGRSEFDYRRNGTVAYLAGWDVHQANLFDRVEAKTGIGPFGRLVEDVMTTEPYASAHTVFWIVDNGSSHAGEASIERLEGAYANLRLIHLPIHASWLNQIELYFSIVQRKALTPNDFDSLEALTERLLRFGNHYRQIAQPFDWTFTRDDLNPLLTKIDNHQPQLQLAASPPKLRTRVLAASQRVLLQHIGPLIS